VAGPDIKEIEFFHSQDPAVKAELEKQKAVEEAKAVPEKKKPAFDPFEDMMGGDSSDEGDLMDFDFSAPPKKEEEKPKPAEKEDKDKEEPEQPSISQSDLETYRLDNLLHSVIMDLRRLGSKVKKSMIMYLCLIISASQINKFYLIKNLLSKDDLLKVLSIDCEKVSQLESDCADIKMKLKKVRGLDQKSEITEIERLQ
jgi:hypothetical protein